MKNIILMTVLIAASINLFGQTDSARDVTLTYHSADNSAADLHTLLRFEGIDFIKLRFTGKDLADKSYHLTVKEIWDGEIKSESTITDSRELYFEQLRKINDTVFTLTVIAKVVDDKIKMTFKTTHLSPRKFDAIKSEADSYSLRHIAGIDGKPIKYGEKFCVLAYILPYEKDGIKYYCAVDNSGKNIDTWGKEFGIKHYLVFEMKFE